MTNEELQKLTVRQVIEMPEFEAELKLQLGLEEKSHTEALLRGRLKRTPLDSLRDNKVFDVEHIRAAFMAALDKSLIGFSSMERQYIHSLGMLAFSRVITKLQQQVKEKEGKSD